MQESIFCGMENTEHEKRRYPRVPVSALAVEVYSAFRETEPSEPCSVADVSEGGMRFVSNRQFELGQVLRLTFSLPGSMLSIRTDARVVHCTHEEGGFGTGAQFHDLGLAEKKLLQHFIHRALRST
jgi:c-di-GMP-binding flagellar brake protein YcgR